MQKSLEDPSRRKNEILQVRTIAKLRELRTKITEGWNYLEDLGFRINIHPWKENKTKTIE
jgi:hypothetical protein